MQDLFVFELANNHQGSVEHGLRIIRALGAIARAHQIRAAVKFQFRELKSFLHPELAHRPGVKHVARFLSTELNAAQFEELRLAVKAEGMLTACTPFDEASVDAAARFDILKVASCSATDWPLLKKIRAANKPVILSTAGLSLGEIDPIVSFFAGARDFSLMHCVALYPTPREELRLNRIDALRQRYPHLTVGYSTHEGPDELAAVQIAYAKGARIFEKHVGLEFEGQAPNAYSATPGQVEAWVESYEQARLACGQSLAPTAAEMRSLHELKRGVFAKRPLRKGEVIREDDVFFALPLPEGKLASGSFREGILAAGDLAVNEPLPPLPPATQTESPLASAARTLALAGVKVPPGTPVEVSHHYGPDRFAEAGAVIYTFVNRAYCKKLLVLQPGQSHPTHLHREKEETFFLLHGDLTVEMEGHVKEMRAGDQLLIPTGCWHSFHSERGAVVEEISTRHMDGDSVYQDSAIGQRSERKSFPRPQA